MAFVAHNPGSCRATEAGSNHVWFKAYPPDVPPSLSYPEASLSALLENAAERFPDRTACTLYGQSTQFRQLAEQSRHLAGSLVKLGIGPGRHVGMLLPNVPEYLTALQATWLTGATALQLSPLMVAEELQKWIQLTDCKVIVTLDLLAPLLADALRQGPLEHLVVASLAGHMPSWRSWLYRVERVRRHGPFRLRENAQVHLFDHLLEESSAAPVSPVDPHTDVAVLTPTGGTTGSPKAVMLTHRNLLANALQLRAWSRGVDGTESVLGVLPFFHSYGLSVCVLTSWACGSTIHLYPRFEARAVLDLLERYQIDLVPAVPAMIAAMNRHLQKRPRDLSHIRAVISGASAMDPQVRKKFQGFGAQQIVEGYGLSEASPVTHVTPVDGADHTGTVGLPLPDTEARIMDQLTGTEELPAGVVGELVVRGPQIMKGYYKNPEETARAVRDGWLYTGDLARRDADGYFTIVDRKKDIIKTSGFLVFPAEVEEVLSRFPGVAEAAVIGVPDIERGEVVKALIVPGPGNGFKMHALEQFCDEHLGKQKRPRHFEIVRELPKNFLGKVQRRRLREALGHVKD